MAKIGVIPCGYCDDIPLKTFIERPEIHAEVDDAGFADEAGVEVVYLYLEPVIRPRTELQVTLLLIKGKVSEITKINQVVRKQKL